MGETFKPGLNRDKDIPLLYTCLLQYEREIKYKSGSYDFENSHFKSFCKANDIRCKNSLAKTELNSKDKRQNYFLFNANPQITISGKDIAHHLFRHIRNSIAHGLIKKNKDYYYLEDKNGSGNLTMTAKIHTHLFHNFFETLKNSAKVK